MLGHPKYAEGAYEQALADSFLEVDKILFTAEGVEEIKSIQAELAADGPKSPLDMIADKGPDGKGCTANVVLIKGETLYIANAGDSRSVLATKGVGIELSLDHKPENEKEIARITKAGGYVTNGRVMGNLNLSRALGDLQYKRTPGIKQEDQMITAMPDIVKQKLGADYDFIVMGCDGVYDTLTNQQIVTYFYNGFKAKPEAKLKDLVESFVDSLISANVMQNEGRGCDNMTCIVIKFNKS